MKERTLRELGVAGKKVLVRVDFNVPLENGEVADDTRIRACLPTIQYLLNKKAKIILLSHLGRPKDARDPALSLEPVASYLGNLLGKKINFCSDTIGEEAQKCADALSGGEILLLENLRFNPGEKANDPRFVEQLSQLGDVYVNDAFGAVHRTHASVVGIAKKLPSAAGLLLERELIAFENLLSSPQHPFVAVLGGNKISDKIGVIRNLMHVVDVLLIGGGMCFTFYKARGMEIGKSLLESDHLETAAEAERLAAQSGVELILPVDIVVADSITQPTSIGMTTPEHIPPDKLGLDIGPKTADKYCKVISTASTVFWNGPMGVFELEPFAAGTRSVAECVGDSQALTIVGGGDTDAALRKFGLLDKISHVSTGGGASMKLLEGANLPGVEVLRD